MKLDYRLALNVEVKVWGKAICLIYLGIESIVDVNRKKIKVNHTIFALIVACCVGAITQELSWKLMVGGVAIGIVMVGASLLSQGRIGIGDGMSLIVTGVCLGLYDNLSILSYGACFAGLYAMILLAIKKRGDYKIPFLPFLLVGYVVTLLVGEAI